MLSKNKYNIFLLLILLSANLIAQVSCPPKTGVQKKSPFQKIFGSIMYYCVNDVMGASIKDKNIIGKWEVVEARRKTKFYDGKYHEEAKTFTYVGEIDGIKAIEFAKDRTTTYTADTSITCSTQGVLWAYLKPDEKIRGYGYDYESDSTEYDDLKGDGRIFQFQFYKDGRLIGYPGLEIQKLIRNKLVIGNIPDEDEYSGYEITLRKVKRWRGRK